MKKLTTKQRILQSEIEDIHSYVYPYRKSTNLFALKLTKEKLIRSEVLSDAVLIEEAMNLVIMDCILTDSKKWKEIEYFGKIKRFLILSNDILTYVSPFKKIEILKSLLKKSKSWNEIKKILPELFNLRNTFAHFFYVEPSEHNIFYKNRNIFDEITFREYTNDMSRVIRFFMKRLNIKRIKV